MVCVLNITQGISSAFDYGRTCALRFKGTKKIDLHSCGEHHYNFTRLRNFQSFFGTEWIQSVQQVRLLQL